MKKSLLALSTAAFLTVSSIIPATAAGNYSPIPGKPQPATTLVEKMNNMKVAQAIGYVCRNGYAWCTPGGWGYVGAPCCCPAYNFCGWVSTN